MNRRLHTLLVLLLAVVFTVGLAFATVELPYLVDGALQETLRTPSGDSHADELSRLKTELFIAHYNLRAIGYGCFAVLVALIVAGYTTRRSGLAAVGAVGFMLPVFAQFAAVMFFLAGLGALNILWLPLLDISFELQRLGVVIRAPYDGLAWLLGLIGINAYWPVALSCISVGLLIFLLGTFAWLSTRARKQAVADVLVYRISRHPQYLGWILWTYGVYLLLLRGLYPKRSWGIDASLPWLLSTMVIIGVAMLEELSMRRRHGERYEEYRRSAPFLFPVPRVVEKLFALPFWVFFRKERADRKREIAVVLSCYTVLLIGASAFFYGSGLDRTLVVLRPSVTRETVMQQLADRLTTEPNRRRVYFIGRELVAFGDLAVDYFLPMLESERVDVRVIAAEALADRPAERALPGLVQALNDPEANVRGRAVAALGAIGSRDAVKPLLTMLEDEEPWIRIEAARALARLGAQQAVTSAEQLLVAPEWWARIAGIEVLGTVGSDSAVPAVAGMLRDEEPRVRRAAVIGLIQIGSPQVRGALEQAQRDDDWEVRIYAAEGLKRISDRR